MNRILRVACMAFVAAVLFSACMKSDEESYSENETRSLREWISIHRPELMDNYQSQGDYYVDIIELGDIDAEPINDTATWVRYTFTGRNLAGDIVQTRNEVDAKQVGSYSPFTYYVPYFRFYAGDENISLLEGTYLSMRNTLNLGKEYAEERGYPQQVLMRYGTKVTLYMPSSIVGPNGLGGSGGYEGQSGYELKSGRPLIVTMQITDTVKYPLLRETNKLNQFMEDNGELHPAMVTLPSAPKAATRQDSLYIDINDPYTDRYHRWYYVKDSLPENEIPEVYVNVRYKPTEQFKYPQVYSSIYAPYANFAAFEKNICDTLVNRFGAYQGPEHISAADTISLDGTAKIWYITRFLDGFILDSNIPGVRQLAYGETTTKTKVLSYRPSDDDMIKAFYYAIPGLRYGQWAAILTSSSFAYGGAGKAGGTDSSSSYEQSYGDYLNYMNRYYGMNGYLNNSYNNPYSDNLLNAPSVITKTNIVTEVPPFTPLLFQIYIEPQTEE